MVNALYLGNVVEQAVQAKANRPAQTIASG